MTTKAKPSPLEECELSAVIERVERSYYISAEPDLRRIDDEAILTAFGTVEEISGRFKRYRGKSIEMSFVCARSFSRDAASPLTEKPFLCSMNLRGECSLMVYMPSDAFWALPEMITSKSLTQVDVRFGTGRRGYTELLSVYLR